MEDIDGGLHPAVDGQNLDEDEDETEINRSTNEETLVNFRVSQSYYSCDY